MGAARWLSNSSGIPAPIALARSMSALRFDSTNAALVPIASEPVPGPGQALVRPTCMIITSPDVAVFAGRTGFTGVLGHACVAVVERVGPAIAPSETPSVQHTSGKPRVRLGTPTRAGRADLEPGTRVVIASQVACGACERCKAGLSPHCLHRRALGLHGHDGVFADMCVVPAANMIAVPKELPDDVAVFASLAAGALHACSLVRVETKPYVTVLGDGPVGLLAAQALAKVNTSVRVVGKHAGKAGLCDKWGIKHRLVGEVGRHQDQDVVIDCTGSPSGTELATQLVRPRGTVIVKGWPVPARGVLAGTARVNLAHALAHEITILAAGVGVLADGLEALRAGTLQTAPLITGRKHLASWAEAFELGARSETLSVLMEP